MVDSLLNVTSTDVKQERTCATKKFITAEVSKRLDVQAVGHSLINLMCLKGGGAIKHSIVINSDQYYCDTVINDLK